MLMIKLTVKYFNSILQAYPSLWLVSYLHKDFICGAACFTIKRIVFYSFVYEISCILVAPLHRFCDVRKQSSPNPRYYVKALINFHKTVKFGASNNEANLAYWS